MYPLKLEEKTSWPQSSMDHTRLPRRLVKLRIKLQLPDKICIHNVFHVSCLKKMSGKHQKVQKILPMLDDEGRIIWELEAIISTKERRLRS